MNKEECIEILSVIKIGLSRTEKEALEFAIERLENDTSDNRLEDDMK